MSRHCVRRFRLSFEVAGEDGAVAVVNLATFHGLVTWPLVIQDVGREVVWASLLRSGHFGRRVRPPKWYQGCHRLVSSIRELHIAGCVMDHEADFSGKDVVPDRSKSWRPQKWHYDCHGLGQICANDIKICTKNADLPKYQGSTMMITPGVKAGIFQQEFISNAQVRKPLYCVLAQPGASKSSRD